MTLKSLSILFILMESIYLLACSDLLEPKNKKPTANIEVSQYTGATGDAINVTATGTDEDGKVVSGYFGLEGSLQPFTGASSTKTFTFSEPGKYVFSANVKDNDGAVSETVLSDTLYITQGNRAPTLDFNADRTNITIGDDVTLSWNAQDLDDNLLGVHFNGKFYEETTKDTVLSGLEIGTHIYLTQAEDEEGARSEKKKVTVVVNPTNPPTHAFSINPQSGTSSDDYEISIQGSDTDGTVDSVFYQIDDGDWIGNAGNNIFETIKLAKGEHVISAYVKDNGGASSNPSSENVSVADSPGSLNIVAPSGMINEGDDYTVSWNYDDVDADPVSITVWADDDNDPSNGKGTQIHTSTNRTGQFSTPATTWNGSESVFAYVEANQDGVIADDYGMEGTINRTEILTDPGLTGTQGGGDAAALNDVISTRPASQNYSANVIESIDDVDFTIDGDSIRVNIGASAAVGDHNYTLRTVDDNGLETLSNFNLHIDEGNSNYRIHGTTANESARELLTQGQWHFETSDGTEYVAPLNGSGEYDITIPASAGSLVKTWFSGHNDYDDSNTFTLVKKDRTAATGVTASSDDAWNYALGRARDTLEVSVEDLAHNAGHYALVMADSLAGDQDFLDILSYGDVSGLRGMNKWVYDNVNFWKRTDYNSNPGQPLTASDLAKQDTAVEFFTGNATYNNKFETPIGLVLAEPNVQTGSGRPTSFPYHTFAMVEHDNNVNPNNTQYFDFNPSNNIVGTRSSVKNSNNVATLISEIAESFNVWDDSSNDNFYAFEFPTGTITDFSDRGYSVWVPSWSYKAGSFEKPQ